MRNRSIILLIGLFLHTLSSSFVTEIPRLLATHGGVRGNPAAWYPAAIFYVLFSACVWKFMSSDSKENRKWLMISINFLVFSLIICSRPFYSAFHILYAVQILIITLFYLLECEPVSNKNTILLVSLSLFLGLFENQLVIQYIFAGLFAYCVINIFLESSLSLKVKQSHQLINSSDSFSG